MTRTLSIKTTQSISISALGMISTPKAGAQFSPFTFERMPGRDTLPRKSDIFGPSKPLFQREIPKQVPSLKGFVQYQPQSVHTDRTVLNNDSFTNSSILYQRPDVTILPPSQLTQAVKRIEGKKSKMTARLQPLVVKQPSSDTNKSSSFLGNEWQTTYKNPNVTILPFSKPLATPKVESVSEKPVQVLAKAVEHVTQTESTADLPNAPQEVLERNVLKQVASLPSVKAEITHAEQTMRKYSVVIEQSQDGEQSQSITKQEAQIQVIQALENNIAKIAKTYVVSEKKKLVALVSPDVGKIELLTSDEYKKVVKKLAKKKAIGNVRLRLLSFGKLIAIEEIEKIVAEKEELSDKEEKELEEKDIYIKILSEELNMPDVDPYVFKRDEFADENRLRAFGYAANAAFALKNVDEVNGKDVTSLVPLHKGMISKLALLLKRRDGSLEEIVQDLKKIKHFASLMAAKRAITRLIIHKPAVKIEVGTTPNVTNTDVKRVLKEFVFGNTQFA